MQNSRLTKFAIWIKENTRILTLIGAVFFLLTCLAAIFWVCKYDVEPIAFGLSMITSIFFGLPHIAEFIVPSRKPIKDMTYEEILEFIKTTDSKNDWDRVFSYLMTESFLKKDPRLRFKVKYDDDGICCKDFKEDWANKHPNPNATSYFYDLSYDNNLIKRFVLVSVDGGRSNLPIPDFYTRKVSFMDYKVAQIHDSMETLDQYMNRSKLELETELTVT